MLNKLTTLFAALFVAGSVTFAGDSLTVPADAATPRQEISLDGPGWRVWLDDKAAWMGDKLYAPNEFKLADLPVNPPTGGWDVPAAQGVACAVPACVEQLFAKGDPAYVYQGVSWFVRTVDIPAAWQGKCVRLDIARAHLRVEVYLNRKLAGYDLCMESPCGFDLTPFIEAGKANELAIRITNPGGARGFSDTGFTVWGKNRLPSGRNFGGLDTLTLTVADPVHIADVFVMNQLPAGARNLEIRCTIRNATAQPVKRILRVRVAEVEKAVEVELKPGETETVVPLTVPGAKLWSPDTPNLYTCETVLRDGSVTADNFSRRFGFRVFEVKPRADGKACFYLNGQRFRHRSAIDFGQYAHTGLHATDTEVRRSIQAAKDIGHNGINLHRHIGEYRMFDAADEMGLALYEEPGGLQELRKPNCGIAPGSLVDKILQEKVRRMACRGRNHPSLLIHNLSNENGEWNSVRETAMKTINAVNPTVFVCNCSGEHNYNPGKNPNRHIAPYGKEIQTGQFADPHTVGSSARFQEGVLGSHGEASGKKLFYYGEVACYCGPANWWLTAEQAKEAGNSYDLATYALNHGKIDKAFKEWNLADIGSRLICSPADVSRQAGRGLMYIDGRLSQRIMARDNVDGFAINGWSAHSYCTPKPCTPNFDAWDSAIVDAGRNLKGPAADYAYWTRPSQIAVFRKSGKFVMPGNEATFELNLINERVIAPGNCTLTLSVTDGAGRKTGFTETRSARVSSGDIYAQALGSVTVPIKPNWRAGHLTLCAELKDASGKVVADGKEQVLLQNRASWKADLAGAKLAIADWPAAEAAIKAAETATVPVETANVILAGSITDTDKLLVRAEAGATLIIKFDAAWAKLLHEKGILSAPVTQWGGVQTGDACGWFGNGWGYLDHFCGNQGVPSKTTLTTSSWEVPADPSGFYPFASTHKLSAYGLHFSRHPQQTFPSGKKASNFMKACAAASGIGDTNAPTLLVLLGAIDYGKGKIVLAPSYPIDANQAFNDMLFFNLIINANKKEW